MFYRFGFESEFYSSLPRIPFHVRMKLDVTGIKISLKDWLAFSLEERWALCHLPAETEEERNHFSSRLDSLMRRYKGEEAPRVPRPVETPWEDPAQIPSSVVAKCEGRERLVALNEWAQWSPCQRYALVKLSVSKSEPEQFYEALREFRQGIGGPS